MPRSTLHPEFPSVTEVLAGVGLTREYPDNPIMAAARRRGQVVHRAIELHHHERLDIESLDPRIRPYFDGYLRFLDDTGHKPLYSELEVVSKNLGVIGHIDRVSCADALVDFKTTEDVDLRAAKLQLAGYRLLFEESRGPVVMDCQVLQLQRDGRYRLHNVMDDYAMVVFRSALVVFTEKGKR